MVLQAVGAALAGSVAQALGQGTVGTARAIGIMAVISILVTLVLTPGLRRSAPS